MFNMQQMMKQAQAMQKKMESAQEELATIEVTGSSAGGAVTVVFNGKNEIQSIKIKAEAINPENPESVDEDTIEMLEDMIMSAMKAAHDQASNMAQEKMKSITGGLNLNIPGLF